MCGILRSGPSGTLQHSDFPTVVGRGELDSNLADAIVFEVRLLPPCCWGTAVAAASVAGGLFSNQALICGQSVWSDRMLYN